jgi:hypothetical protein
MVYFMLIWDALVRTVVSVSDCRHCLDIVLDEGCVTGDEGCLVSGCAGLEMLEVLSTMHHQALRLFGFAYDSYHRS